MISISVKGGRGRGEGGLGGEGEGGEETEEEADRKAFQKSISTGLGSLRRPSLHRATCSSSFTFLEESLTLKFVAKKGAEKKEEEKLVKF